MGARASENTAKRLRRWTCRSLNLLVTLCLLNLYRSIRHAFHRLDRTATVRLGYSILELDTMFSARPPHNALAKHAAAIAYEKLMWLC